MCCICPCSLFPNSLQVHFFSIHHYKFFNISLQTYETKHFYGKKQTFIEDTYYFYKFVPNAFAPIGITTRVQRSATFAQTLTKNHKNPFNLGRRPLLGALGFCIKGEKSLDETAKCSLQFQSSSKHLVG